MSKRPPLPRVVTVGWMWDGSRWIIDWTDIDAKMCRRMCADGLVSLRHRYVVYQAKRGKP